MERQAAALSQCLDQKALVFMTAARNSSEAYWDAAQSDNMRFHFHPAAIVYAQSAGDVQAAVACGAQYGVAVAARSGGHSFVGHGSGGQDGSLVVDVGQLADVRLEGDVAHVEPGARLGDVVKALWAQGRRAMPHGTCPPVGVGGHALCGGFGPTSRRWGMTADNIVAADVVLANSTLVRASATENAELWWALRGAGAYFGIVTRFEFSTYDASPPGVFIEYRWSPSLRSPADLTRLVEAVQDFALDARLPPELGFHLQFQAPTPNDPRGGVVSVHLRGIYGGALGAYTPQWERLLAALRSRNAPPPDVRTEREMSFLALMEEWDDFGQAGNKLDTQAERLAHNNFVSRTSLSLGQQALSRNALNPVFETIWRRASQHREQLGQGWMWNVYMEMFGGGAGNARHAAPDMVAQSALPHRDGTWLVQSTVGTAGTQHLGGAARETLDELDAVFQQALRSDGIGRAGFACYAEATLPADQWRSLYYGDNAPRLERLKRQLDAGNVFRNPQSMLVDGAQPAKAADIYIAHPLP
ncbi:FAD-binding domain-containing protein [Tilletiopsis washingtonensis]|uniref:FAD-binding domain-containing protein n=1 Tax=Tilletiopsis washingtonensis TaxID=58919 RepID=A0A316Z5Q8_9BASI|nr:FAD-binding domain-containing protein [Tilletiopsis washingtonensis]PWN97117.1 FAD-binding domain-containing protein [Tilletiopsis washingtonensis]